jgi:glucokinase
MNITIGLDIGGTKIMVAAADSDGTLLRRVLADTPTDLAEGLALLRRLTAEVQGSDTLTAIGAAVGGPLDWRTGVVSPLHQPEWRNVPLKAIFEQEFGCPFFVDVDTNAAALAEWRAGEEKAGRLLYLTLSTGMGAAF